MKSFLSVFVVMLFTAAVYSFAPVKNTVPDLPATAKSISVTEPLACSSFPEFTGRKWMMEEIRFLQDNEPFYYKRGNAGESNMNFDRDWIIFNCEGTGIYHQADGKEFTLEWKVDENKSATVVYAISNFRFNGDLTVTLENIEQSGDQVRYTEYYTHLNKVHSLGVVKRTSQSPDADLVAKN